MWPPVRSRQQDVGRDENLPFERRRERRGTFYAPLTPACFLTFFRHRIDSIVRMIDHLLWAAPDLESGRRRIGELTGVEPVRGGRHPGVGTENALLGLGGERYLEIIALDPTQSERSSLGLALEGLREPGLLTWCARASDIESTAGAARRTGLDAGEPTAMSRERPDGSRLEWRLLFLDGHDEGLLLPFFIEWSEGTVHPSRGAPGGCRLERFELVHPDPGKLNGLLAAFGLEVAVDEGPSPRMVAELQTPCGPVTLEGPPAGIRR